MCLIMEGSVILSIKKKAVNEYFTLPKNTYFGDYQILLGYKASECYTSDGKETTLLMCIKKKVLKDLLKKFPEVRDYYIQRAKQRRIEFKRVFYYVFIYQIKKQFQQEIGMIGDSDIDEEKATKIEYYDKTVPIFLSDPNYYFT